MTITFIGRFVDVNNTQTFRLTYKVNGTNQTPVNFTFSKIKSFANYEDESRPKPTPLLIDATRCQVQNINISFPNVQFANKFTNPKQVYGTNTSYEYLLPANWSMNGQTSNGSNWIAGTNNVTVTTDAINGHSGAVRIRAVNNCGANLIKGPETSIPVSRNRTVTGITGDNSICSGSKNYSISGTLPPGATVCWSSSNTNVATVPASNCGTTIPLSYVTPGIVTLTATVTDCIETYNLAPKTILIGAAVGGTYQIFANSASGIFNLYNNNGAVWLNANDVFEIKTTLNSPGLHSYTWSRASNSYPFTWSTSPTQMNFSGTSGATAYAQRDGIFNLTAQTDCGTYTGSFNWQIVVKGWSFAVVTSPNPATTDMQVSLIDEVAEVKVLGKKEKVTLTLYDFNSATPVKAWNFTNDRKTFHLNVADLKKGRYILVVKKGKYQQSTHIMID